MNTVETGNGLARSWWWLFAAAAVTFLPALCFYYVGEEAIFPISALEMWFHGEPVKRLLFGADLQHNPLFAWLIIPPASLFGWDSMLVVARGLMGEPKLLAIDEPSMGLAPIMIKDLIEMLRTAVATGVAVLLVEQNTALAAELADRVYVLVRGTVRAERAGGELPTDLLADYLV